MDLEGSRQRDGAIELQPLLQSDGDKSPAESGDESPHSKASPFAFIRVFRGQLLPP